MRRHDYLEVLRKTALSSGTEDSGSIYAWFRLGCYRRVIEIADQRPPRSAHDICAVAVSLAAVGRFRDSETFVTGHLTKLRRRPRCAVETAQGIVRFMPALALQICDGIPAARSLRSAAHFALGEVDQARLELRGVGTIDRGALLAGHHLLVANLSDDPRLKIKAVNRQLSSAGLEGLILDQQEQGLVLENLRNPQVTACEAGPLVSVIVPAFDAADHLRMSVTSLLQQSYRNLEIIIVNDGSCDGTGQIAEELSASDDRVRVLHFERNRGAYAARNAGLRAATGSFVTVHDSDDFAHCRKIERQVAPLMRDSRMVFTTSDLVRVSAEGLLARREVYPLQRMNSSSLTFRRDAVLRDCGLWEEERVGADGEFLFRLHRIYSEHQRARLRQLLTFAADRAGSLTALVPNGAPGVPADPRRLDYTEAYTLRWLREGWSDRHG